ncbi:MAG: carbohydrate ABC transporter substrate-binding protein [Clostridia bacterium]|nr:carbohydrate ABC transporter substrate-binding protein [Clostridia bacterium]
MNTKRIIALLMVCAMALPLLVACNTSKGGESNGGGANISAEGSVVPEDLTFPGETFTILCREDNAWGNWLHEISADEDSTELVNEMVYKRNLEVEERFELEELKAFAIPGQWAVGDDFVNTFKNSILSNSSSYDLIMSHQAYMSSDPQLNDLYTNLYDVPYIKDNLDADYYYPDVVDELTINGKLLYLLGDYSLTYWENAYVLYFNKTIAENNQLEDIYQLVRDGEWTFDKMTEMAKGTWIDLNGDVWPDDGDSFGYVSDIPNTTDALEAHFDVPMTGRDEAGNVVFNVDQGKMVNILEKFIEFKKSDDTHFIYTTSSDTEDSNVADKIFREGRALFYPAMLNRAQEFRGMETDFGIVPYPKWNEQQDKYYTHAQDGYSVGVIPADVKNRELCGAVLDVLSALSSELVIPAYYDMALRDKYARDDESGEMLDLIREGFTVNFGYFYGPSLNGCSKTFRILIEQDNSNFVSYYSTNSKGYDRMLKKLIASYADDEQ